MNNYSITDLLIGLEKLLNALDLNHMNEAFMFHNYEFTNNQLSILNSHLGEIELPGQFIKNYELESDKSIKVI